MQIFLKKRSKSENRYFLYDSDKVRKNRWRMKLWYNTFILQNFTPIQFITLTYSPRFYESERIRAGNHFRLFMNRLKNRLRKAHKPYKFSYVRVTERGKKKGRVHMHLLVDQSIPMKLISSAWRAGMTHAERIGASTIHRKTVESQRKVLAYIAKYVTKDEKFDPNFSQVFKKEICGQQISTSRSITQVPADKMVWWTKTGPNENFDLKFELKDRTYYNWQTVYARTKFDRSFIQSEKNKEESQSVGEEQLIQILKILGEESEANPPKKLHTPKHKLPKAVKCPQSKVRSEAPNFEKDWGLGRSPSKKIKLAPWFVLPGGGKKTYRGHEQ